VDFGISVLLVTFVNSLKKTIYNGKHGGFYKKGWKLFWIIIA
jgi:hypothetical protein